MVDGIGRITVACSRNLVRRLILDCIFLLSLLNSLLSLKKFEAPRGCSWTRWRSIFRRTFESFFRIYMQPTLPLSAQCFVKRRLCFSEY